jgi:hypothetical protein
MEASQESVLVRSWLWQYAALVAISLLGVMKFSPLLGWHLCLLFIAIGSRSWSVENLYSCSSPLYAKSLYHEIEVFTCPELNRLLNRCHHL